MQTLSIRSVTPQLRGCERIMNDKLNKLYTNFVGRDVLDGISADNFDSLKNDAFITPENKQFFDDMLRVGWLSGQLSSSGPMPNTSKILLASATASSQNVTFFTPAAGEVWSIQGFAQNKVGSFTAGVTGYLIVDDGSQTTSIDMVVRRISSSTADPQEDSDFGTPIFVDQNMTVKYRPYSTGFGDSVEGQIYCIRVR